MKKFFALIFILFTFSCDDGNFEIASFEFEDKVNYCGKYVLYRLSTREHKEAFIVTLTEQQIKQSDEPVLPVSISETGLFTVTYRLFDEAVTSSYFCQSVPPIVPKTVKNWVGTAGTIFVQNEPVYDEDEVTVIAYQHIIVLNDLVLSNGDESIIFDETYLYGEFETAVN